MDLESLTIKKIKINLYVLYYFVMKLMNNMIKMQMECTYVKFI